MLILIAFLIGLTPSAGADVRPESVLPVFPPCGPESELSYFLDTGEPSPQFCAKWNPDFAFNGHQCCAKYVPGIPRKPVNRCSPTRRHQSFCGEMTEQQIEYAKAVEAGRLGDLLKLVSREMGMKGDQAYCTVNNGFLAYGRQLIPSEVNRINIRFPERCTNFGTDAMIGMMEWLGREVGKNYPSSKYRDVRLVVGDISAPKGGCMFGRSGIRGHASHTSGQDADVGFLTAHPRESSPLRFHYQFDPKINWWMIKKIFKNPFACVKVLFLDRLHIQSLRKFARLDPDWKAYERFIRHMPSHKNHFHIRIGIGPGLPGCIPGAQPELELPDGDDLNEVDSAESWSRKTN